MTWERYEPKSNTQIALGEASLARDGLLRIRDADLEEAGVTGLQVVVMMDTKSRRFMLREPEQLSEPRIELKRRLSPRRPSSQVNVSGVLSRMGITLDAAVRCQVCARPGGGLIVTIPSPPPTKTRATPIRKEADRG